MKKFENFIQGLYDMCHLKYELLPNTVPYFCIMEENELDYKTYLICENNLIFETRSVYRKNDFKNIFKLVSNMEISSFNVLKKDDLNSLCDIKKYGKWKKDKSLAIIKDDFTDFEKFVNFIKMIVDKFNKDELTYAFNTLKIGKSMYMPFSNKVGLMLVNFNKYNEDVIAHEMIHFIQDVTGQGIANVKVDSNNTGKFVQIEKLAKLEQLQSFGIIKKEYLKHVINDYELIPYINNICYLFERNNIKGHKPLEIINELIKFRNNLGDTGTVRELKEEILDKVCFVGITRPELLVLVICLVYNQHLTLLKRTIGNYFKDA